MSKLAVRKMFTISLFLFAYIQVSAATPDAPLLSFSTKDNALDIEWTAVDNATGYTLFYAPYPSAEPLGRLDMGSELSVSGNLPYGSALYLAVQAYNEEGDGDFSNIEYFTLKAADIVQFTSQESDVNAIVYGDSGTSLVVFNGADAPSHAVVTFADGTQGKISAGANGLLSTYEIEGHVFSFDYKNFGLTITLTEPDSTVTTYTQSEPVFTTCPTPTSCYVVNRGVAALSREADELDKQLGNTTTTLAENPLTILACPSWMPQRVCDSVTKFKDGGFEVYNTLIDRKNRNTRQFVTGVTCLVSDAVCEEFMRNDGLEVWQDWIGTENQGSGEKPKGKFEVDDSGIKPDSEMRQDLERNDFQCVTFEGGKCTSWFSAGIDIDGSPCSSAALCLEPELDPGGSSDDEASGGEESGGRASFFTANFQRSGALISSWPADGVICEWFQSVSGTLTFNLQALTVTGTTNLSAPEGNCTNGLVQAGFSRTTSTTVPITVNGDEISFDFFYSGKLQDSYSIETGALNFALDWWFRESVVGGN